MDGWMIRIEWIVWEWKSKHYVQYEAQLVVIFNIFGWMQNASSDIVWYCCWYLIFDVLRIMFIFFLSSSSPRNRYLRLVLCEMNIHSQVKNVFKGLVSQSLWSVSHSKKMSGCFQCCYKENAVVTVARSTTSISAGTVTFFPQWRESIVKLGVTI